jgi:diguanylate cyclase (GGDEF)-like protein
MLSKGIYGELTKVTKTLFETKTTDSIYEQITKSSCTLLKASAALLMIYDRNEKIFSAKHAYHLSEQYLNNAEKDVSIGYSVLKTGKIKIIKDIKQLYRKQDKNILNSLKKQNIVSLVSTPLSIDTNTIGCLNVYFGRALKSFKARESLNFFARMAALAVAHAQLNERTEKTARMINGLEETSMLLASCLAVSDLVNKILAIAVRMGNTDSGSLLLIDEKNKRTIKAFEYNKRTKKTREYISTARLEQGLSGEILKTHRALTVFDLSTYKNVNPVAIEKKRVSVAGIPLIARDRVIGIMFLDSFTPRFFSETEIDYLTLLSNHAAATLENALLDDIVQRETKETALLYEVSQSLISTLDFDQLLKNILQHLKETFDFLNISVLLVNEEQQTLHTHSSISYSPEDGNLRLKIGKDGITGHVAKSKIMYYSPDVQQDNYYIAGNNKTRSEVCFPLLIGERLIGVLDVESTRIDGFTPDTIRLLSSLSAQIAIAIDNARLYAETKKLSLTDPLTALSNRRSFDIFIDAEIKRAERYRRTFVVMMIDFDNFKNYNDKYGHTAGDAVLQKLSKIMKDIIRDVDFLCRYGGDEFVSVLPETDASFALDVAERMRKKIAAQKIQPKITLSIGIASFPHDARDKSRLIDLADQACYEAKQRGGNRVLFTFKPKEDK